MDRERFGRLVRSMRRQRTTIDERHEYRQWTRADLAERAGLAERQVRRIEQGEVTNLHPLLDGLAAAFDLGDLERVEFYAQAGYVCTAPAVPPDWEALADLLARVPYPVYARTPLWDFVATNAYSLRLWEQDTPLIQALWADGLLGANMLRTIFDPRFEHRARKGGDHHWYADAQHCITSFRMMAFRYGHTARYRQILAEMQKLPEFARHWDLTRQIPASEALGSSPLLAVHHPAYGRLDFLSTRLPRHYAGEPIDIAVYVPLPASETAYRRLCADVPQNRVTLFREAWEALQG
ncbi:MAG: helix-turn-helix domain-containing protein [Anaerolineae bacterium]|nr:helix-turn-helix domain-containing protein [Anaerolineae bacterium]